MSAYKTKFNERIDEMYAKTKRGELPRELRMVEIEALTDWYVKNTGKRPDDKALERLSDLILYEELTDPHPDKVTRTEYPFLSETQFDERHKGEASFKLAEEYGVDGRNHKPPTRRDRTGYENRLVDKKARARNKERQRRYNDFTRVQPVVVTKMSL